jgi:hypothetical protein
MWAPEAVSLLRDIATRLAVSPIDMLKVMANESGCLPDPPHNGPARGLIQFEPQTLADEGWTASPDAFAAQHVVEQLPYVYRYFAARKSMLAAAGGGLGALYTATFLPAFTPYAGDIAYTLCALNGRLPWAYKANPGFDRANKGYITVGDLVNAAERAFAACPLAQQVAAAVGALEPAA